LPYMEARHVPNYVAETINFFNLRRRG